MSTRDAGPVNPNVDALVAAMTNVSEAERALISFNPQLVATVDIENDRQLWRRDSAALIAIHNIWVLLIMLASPVHEVCQQMLFAQAAFTRNRGDSRDTSYLGSKDASIEEACKDSDIKDRMVSLSQLIDKIKQLWPPDTEVN